MSKLLNENIVGAEKITSLVHKITVKSPYVCQNAKPGQFVNIKCNEGLSMILRRPISIANVDKDNNTFDIFYQIRGGGTECLSQKKAGQELNFIGPLGNPFDISEQYKNIAVVGGGIGIFPLYYILKNKKTANRSAFLGFRSKEHIALEKEFQEVTDNFIITTDDGSCGEKGLITHMFEEDLKKHKYDIIYTCGPLPMMKKVVELADIHNIKCQISMEQRMGCGIGACLVCACKIKSKKSDQSWEYGHVCKDGPVFWSDQVILEESEDET